jgi:hypothetical protein
VPVNLTNTGIATSANQNTANSLLSSIMSYTGSLATLVYTSIFLQKLVILFGGDGYAVDHSIHAIRKMQTQWVQNYEVDETSTTLDINKTPDAREYPTAQFDAINFVITNNDVEPLRVDISFWNENSGGYDVFYTLVVAKGATAQDYIKFMPTYLGQWHGSDNRYGKIRFTGSGTINYDAIINFTLTPIKDKK